MIDGRRLANGLDVRKVRVPLGVVAVVYEARPNVTIDAAALCLKAGNAIVLRGSSSAAHSNAALAQIAARGGARRRAARWLRQPHQRRRPRGARRARHPERHRRPDHSARRRGPEAGAAGGGHRTRDLRRIGQLPRICRRRRRSRPGRGDRAQRQDPAPRRLQRRRDAAGARARRRRVPSAHARRARPAPRSRSAPTIAPTTPSPTAVAIRRSEDR